MKREWKGTPTKPGLCGAELKIGMLVPVGIRCELPRDHRGAHRSGKVTWSEPAKPAPRKDIP
jgi:hypothetical protein